MGAHHPAPPSGTRWNANLKGMSVLPMVPLPPFGGGLSNSTRAPCARETESKYGVGGSSLWWRTAPSIRKNLPSTAAGTPSVTRGRRL